MTFNLLDLPNEALNNINLDDKLDNNISFNDSFINEKDKPFNYFNNDLLLSKKKEPLTIDFKNDFFINNVHTKNSSLDLSQLIIEFSGKKEFNKDLCSINEVKNKFLQKKTSHTKIFIKSLFDLNLTSYEVNHIYKLIKSFWISGIYFLLNKKVGLLFNKYKLKAEGFVFEFFYVKTSLIETDNTEENLSLLDIKTKDLVLGNIISHNNFKESENKIQINNKINNNKRLINYLIGAIKTIKLSENEKNIIQEILMVLDSDISLFIDVLWKEKNKCNDIENQFKEFCNKDLLKAKFQKSKEILKILLKKVYLEYPSELEKIIKRNFKPKEEFINNLINNINIIKKIKENNKIKLFMNEIIEKMLEISKKEKFESYFKKKRKRKNRK